MARQFKYVSGSLAAAATYSPSPAAGEVWFLDSRAAYMDTGYMTIAYSTWNMGRSWLETTKADVPRTHSSTKPLVGVMTGTTFTSNETVTLLSGTASASPQTNTPSLWFKNEDTVTHYYRLPWEVVAATDEKIHGIGCAVAVMSQGASLANAVTNAMTYRLLKPEPGFSYLVTQINVGAYSGSPSNTVDLYYTSSTGLDTIVAYGGTGGNIRQGVPFWIFDDSGLTLRASSYTSSTCAHIAMIRWIRYQNSDIAEYANRLCLKFEQVAQNQVITLQPPVGETWYIQMGSHQKSSPTLNCKWNGTGTAFTGNTSNVTTTPLGLPDQFSLTNDNYLTIYHTSATAQDLVFYGVKEIG